MSDCMNDKIEHKNYDAYNPDSIAYVTGLSIRTRNALIRAGITTLSALKETTDIYLIRVRNVGVKCLAEINAAVPDRVRTYDGEEDYIKSQRKKGKLDRDARRILRFMQYQNMKLSELIKSSYRIPGKRKARQLLAEYCAAFPERINDVIEHFEEMGDTSDRFYIDLKFEAGNVSMPK